MTNPFWPTSLFSVKWVIGILVVIGIAIAVIQSGVLPHAVECVPAPVTKDSFGLNLSIFTFTSTSCNRTERTYPSGGKYGGTFNYQQTWNVEYNGQRGTVTDQAEGTSYYTYTLTTNVSSEFPELGKLFFDQVCNTIIEKAENPGNYTEAAAACQAQSTIPRTITLRTHQGPGGEVSISFDS